MENKEAKTNVTNEELMKKIEGLEKELKRANENIVMGLNTLTLMYAPLQIELREKIENGTATQSEKSLNKSFTLGDIAIRGVVKQQEKKMLGELNNNGEEKEYSDFKDIMDLIFGF